MGKTVFGLKNIFIFFLIISSVFAFKQAKEHTLFQVKTIKKNLNKNCFFAHFRVTFKIFRGPATKERGNIKTLNFGIGVLQQFGTA